MVGMVGSKQYVHPPPYTFLPDVCVMKTVGGHDELVLVLVTDADNLLASGAGLRRLTLSARPPPHLSAKS